jgi:hypothetical protein
MGYEFAAVKFVELNSRNFRKVINEIESDISAGKKIGIQIGLSLSADDGFDYINDVPRNISGLQLDIGASGKAYKLCSRFSDIEVLNVSDLKNDLELSKFEELKYYMGPWPKAAPFIFRNLSGLYTESKSAVDEDFALISEMKSLKYLHIKKSKISSIEFISGLSIAELDIYGAENLVDISAVMRCDSLRRINIENCRKLNIKFEIFQEIKALNKLSFSKIGGIDTLSPIGKMAGIDSITFFDCMVYDKDLSHVLDSQSLRKLNGRNDKSFVPSLSEIRRALQLRR